MEPRGVAARSVPGDANHIERSEDECRQIVALDPQTQPIWRSAEDKLGGAPLRLSLLRGKRLHSEYLAGLPCVRGAVQGIRI